MAQRMVFADARLDVNPGSRRLEADRDGETSFRIALLGDFRGRQSRSLRYGPERLEGCRPWAVDKDDFQELLERVSPSVITASGPLEFRDLDDFHPDALYANGPVFVELRRLRKLLRDPEGFRAAARELFAAAESNPAPAEAPPADRGDVLDAILSGGAGEALPPRTAPRAPQRPADAEWKSLIHGIVAPHIIPRADPRQEELLAQIDAAVAEQMRQTLHDPAFQALESAWRSIFLLLDRLETGVDLKIDLIDLSKDELLADVGGDGAIENSGLHRLLVDEAASLAGAETYSVVACLHTFEATATELRALRAIAHVAQLAGTAFVAGVSPAAAGAPRLDRSADPRRWSFKIADEESEEAWSELRDAPEAAWLALAAPRFLLRTPYSEDGASTDLADFEELAANPDHEHFLWASPAVACACLLGEAFMRNGWAMRSSALGLLDRRPVWNVGKGSDREMVPCAEVWLTDTVVERMLERGLTPLVSIKGRDAVAVPRLQSVARPPQALRGPWSAS